jgi:hypothetical protein
MMTSNFARCNIEKVPNAVSIADSTLAQTWYLPFFATEGKGTQLHKLQAFVPSLVVF